MKSKSFKKTRKSKKDKLFYKYSRGKEYLLKSEIVLLMEKEFHIKYNNHIIVSLMNIWGSKYKKNGLVIVNKTFHKLFRKPDGFFRDIKI